MSSPAFKDHFSDNAATYALNRPTYPPELAKVLADASPGRGLALDCGCGNGQLAVLLAGHFERVVATDASAEQIANAKPHEGVEFRVAPAEASGLPDKSVDLITAAQAAHWFDLDAFYAEAARIARSDALLALITYGVMTANGRIGALIDDFYWKQMGPYWPPERRHVEDGYRTLAFPFEQMSLPEVAIEREWSRQQFLGYVDTWSATRAALKAGQQGLLDDFASELAGTWPDDEIATIRWPVTIRAGRVEQ
jgi:SAM-dependent methyltransferase